MQRAQIVELACLEPIARGLHITHSTSQDLARQAVADGLIESISPRTVRQILHDVDLQPHRTRYWKTARLDAQFKERAEKVLWCYGNAERLARRASARWPSMRSRTSKSWSDGRSDGRPCFIERQEFEYIRHGTVNLLLFLIVHTPDGGRRGGREGRRALCPGVEDLPPPASGARRRVLDPRLRPEPYGRGDVGILVELRGWWRPRFTTAKTPDRAKLSVALGGRLLKRASWGFRKRASAWGTPNSIRSKTNSSTPSSIPPIEP